MRVSGIVTIVPIIVEIAVPVIPYSLVNGKIVVAIPIIPTRVMYVTQFCLPKPRRSGKMEFVSALIIPKIAKTRRTPTASSQFGPNKIFIT